MANLAAWIFLMLAAAGVGYTLFAAWVAARFGWGSAPVGTVEPVSLLKPLYGAEPRLAANLASFFDQAWDAPIEMVTGVQRMDDPALGTVAQLRGIDGCEIVGVADTTKHGANAKIGNLINMELAATHDLLVLSDSDMAVPRDYLATIAGALAQPKVGAVTCLYRGRGDAAGWSVLAAAQISYQFLPSVLVGLKLGLAKPCMGSTIALRRATLEAIGGFERFADDLADDYAIGAAVRALGLDVAVPPMILTHGCTESSLADLWRHELRWLATVRGVDPAGFAGAIVTYPLPLALIATLFSPGTGGIVLGAALMARLLLKRQIDRAAGAVTAGWWVLPVRDCLSFATYVAAFFVRSVDWRGARLTMTSKGRIATTPE